MIDLKKIVMCVLFPPLALIILLVPASAALLVISFLWLGSEHPISYGCYVVAAYTLTVVCMRIPKIVRWVKDFKNSNKYITRYTGDEKLRFSLSLAISLLTNVGFAVFQFGLGVYHGSFWFYSLALYYALLALMRVFLFYDVRRTVTAGEHLMAEYRRFRFCGIVLLVMNLALVGMVFFMTYFNRTFTHHFITAIALAAFSFTSLTLAIINIIKYRKHKNPTYSAITAITLAAALVSMLTLETTMLTAFGSGISELSYTGTATSMTEQDKDLMILLTGVAICLFIVLMAMMMIVHATRELRRIKK